MPVVLVPFHLQDRRPTLVDELPAPPATTVEGPPPDDDPWAWYSALHERVAEVVHEAAVADGGGPVGVVSGDCVVAAGVLAGLQRAGRDVGVVWFDAHGDLHTVDSSTSGYPGTAGCRGSRSSSRSRSAPTGSSRSRSAARSARCPG